MGCRSNFFPAPAPTKHILLVILRLFFSHLDTQVAAVPLSCDRSRLAIAKSRLPILAHRQIGLALNAIGGDDVVGSSSLL